jgi:ribosome biogenesis GTPase A
MIIQWYPGHMTKALRQMEENVKKVDAVIYVLDSRAVEACINPKFDGVIGNKPVLYVFNKADTVEAAALKQWCDYFDTLGRSYVKANCASGRDSNAIISKLLELLKSKIEHYRNKGVNARLRAMVVGIPNSGKSTLINCLCAGKKTVTGDRPGVTRSSQWVAVNNDLDLLETPGTLWPSLKIKGLPEIWLI